MPIRTTAHVGRVATILPTPIPPHSSIQFTDLQAISKFAARALTATDGALHRISRMRPHQGPRYCNRHCGRNGGEQHTASHTTGVLVGRLRNGFIGERVVNRGGDSSYSVRGFPPGACQRRGWLDDVEDGVLNQGRTTGGGRRCLAGPQAMSNTSENPTQDQRNRNSSRSGPTFCHHHNHY